MEYINNITKDTPVVAQLISKKETVFENARVLPFEKVKNTLPLSETDIDDAEKRLLRFAPFFEKQFPETAQAHGIIESPLVDITAMKTFLNGSFNADIKGRLLLKLDSHLPVSGSVKARGGIYEVIKHSETLAFENGLLKGDYTVFCSGKSRDFFGKYSINVGSTGNLGLSVGIAGAAFGYRTNVHMSADAKKWKKDLLRSKGVNVVEYNADYCTAVEGGRDATANDPFGYFVDDENSKDLFLGYSVAARRLKKQLNEKKIKVNSDNPLFVYLPCGIGGAPCGITFGLKHEFGDCVYCIFSEPVQAPCMLLGVATGLHDRISVYDIGLSGLTQADGLAVSRPSSFAGKITQNLISGFVTVDDSTLFDLLRALYRTENIFIEPSACAAFQGAIRLGSMKRLADENAFTQEKLSRATHIIWSTGGNLVPADEKEKYLSFYI